MNTGTIDARLGKQIRAMREQQNVPMPKIAAALNVSLVELSDFEAGRRRISASDLYLLTRVLGVEVSDVYAVLRACDPDTDTSAPLA
jgi:transcriptional regulator with XRE-family HTH domain